MRTIGCDLPREHLPDDVARLQEPTRPLKIFRAMPAQPEDLGANMKCGWNVSRPSVESLGPETASQRRGLGDCAIVAVDEAWGYWLAACIDPHHRRALPSQTNCENAPPRPERSDRGSQHCERIRLPKASVLFGPAGTRHVGRIATSYFEMPSSIQSEHRGPRPRRADIDGD
jgi:hypothetical protein